MVLTEFAKNKLIQNEFSPKKVKAISGLADTDLFNPGMNRNNGHYVGFAGRVSPEKGVDLLVEAANRLPNIPFKVAGNFDRGLDLVRQAPSNVDFMGQLDQAALTAFYTRARMIAVPSKWYEGLPMTVVEAMLSSRPVICSDIGGLPEIIDDGVTGLLFQFNDAGDLTEKIQRLWNDPKLCREMGMAAREKAENIYSPDIFYQKLMNICEGALKNEHMSESF